MSKKVLITGIAGFLGSHLALHHIAAGDEVIGLDDFSSSKRDSLHLATIKRLMAEKKLGEVYECDIAEQMQVHYCLQKHAMTKSSAGIDLIYNFACPASPPRYQQIPTKTMMTCVAGTNNIIDVATSNNSVVVHASTSEVYGDPDITPQVESYRGCVNSYGPRACYDEGKRAAEALCYDSLFKYGVDVRLVRIFNTYGPHLDVTDGRVVSNFITQALYNKDITIYGDGSQTRSFCYVDDLIRGIVSLGALSYNPKTPINLGNPNEFTIKELADVVMSLIPSSKSKFVWQSIPIDDPLQRKPDITIAKEILKWQPSVQLLEGLQKTIHYIQNVNVQFT